MLRLLDDPDPRIRGKAAEYLGRLGHRPAIPVLVRLLEDDSPSVVASAVGALEKLEWWPF